MHFIRECKSEIDSGSNRWRECAKCRNWDADRIWNSIRSGVGENYRRLGGEEDGVNEMRRRKGVEEGRKEGGGGL